MQSEDTGQDTRILALRKALGRRIRSLRKEAGLGLETFSNAAGIHRTHLLPLERGDLDVKLSTMVKVAEALHLTTDELLRLAREEEQEETHPPAR